MKLSNLEIFLAVVDTGSMANASRLQHITQPAVSNIIRTLEEEVGTTLIVRSRGQREQLELTPAGRYFVPYARQTISDYNNMRLNIQNITGERPKVSVVTSPSPGSSIVPPLLGSFTQEHMQAIVKSQTIIGYPNGCQLNDTNFDIGISSAKPKNDALSAEPFFYDPIILIASKRMQLPTVLPLKDLKQLPFISRPAHGKNMRLVASKLAQHHVSLDELNTVMEVNGDADVLQAVIASNSVGFITRSLYETSAYQNDIIPVQLKNFVIPRNLYLVKHKKNLSIAAKTLWEFAQSTSWRENFHYDTAPK